MQCNTTAENVVAQPNGRSVKRIRFSQPDTSQESSTEGEGRGSLNVSHHFFRDSAAASDGTVSAVPQPTLAVSGRINCLQAVHFHPVACEEDVYNPRVCFSPLFVHHFFGRKEEIYGFSELSVRLFYTVDTLDMYVKVDAVRSSVLPQGGGNGVVTLSNSDLAAARPEADEGGESSLSDAHGCGEQASLNRILGYLSKVAIPGGFHRSATSFLEAVGSNARSTFIPPGVLIDRFPYCGKGAREGDTLELYKCAFDETFEESQTVRDYHRRVEWFLHFFIDACSNIDQDKHWRILLIFKRSQKAKTETCVQYELVGIVTLYTFFALPGARRRISQFMVLPHFQGNGIGFEVLQRVYRDAIEDPEIAEVTVEDPARSFVQLRDIVGVFMAIERGVIDGNELLGPSLDGSGTAGDQTAALKEKNHPVTLDENRETETAEVQRFIAHSFRALVRKEVKECKRQVRRLTEIICLASLLPRGGENSVIKASSRNPSSSSSPAVAAAVALDSRDWRAVEDTDSSDILSSRMSQFHESAAFRNLRIAVKKRLRQDQIELLCHLSANEQRSELARLWESTYESYCRTIRRVRRAITGKRGESRQK